MIYRAAELEEIVGDLLDAVDDARAAGERLGAEAERVRAENRQMRSTLCAILAATQEGELEGREGEIERMIENALARIALAPGAGS